MLYAPLVSFWCRSDVVCRHDVDKFWSIFVDFLSILVDFCWFWSIFVDFFVDIMSTQKSVSIWSRYMSFDVVDINSTCTRPKWTSNQHTIDKKRQKTTKTTKIDVDIMSTQKSVSTSCRRKISWFLLFFVDGMSIPCRFLSISCYFLSISCRWHVSNMRSTNYPYFVDWCQFFVVFCWRHQNDINFDVDFMSTIQFFFVCFLKFFSFLTYVDMVWTLKKIYRFTMISKRYCFLSYIIRKDTIGMTQSVHSNKNR